MLTKRRSKKGNLRLNQKARATTNFHIMYQTLKDYEKETLCVYES